MICRSAVHLQFTNEEWESCTDKYSGAVCVESTDGYDVLDGLSRVYLVLDSEDTFVTDILALAGIGLGWMLIGILLAVYKSNQSSKILPNKDDDAARRGTDVTGQKISTLRENDKEYNNSSSEEEVGEGGDYEAGRMENGGSLEA